MARVCFFARVRDPAVLDRVEFYAQDLRILRSLGHDVIVATRPHELRPADLYFCWWWTWAFAPLVLARVLRRPVLVTGVFDEWMFDTRPPHERALMTWALRSADANVFVSKLEAEGVPARWRTTAPSFVPNVVDGEVYSPDAARPREPLVLMVAWLHAANAERKGVADVLRAVPLVRARVPAVRFVIAGEHGTGYPALHRLARDLAVEDIVSFPGVVSREEKIDLMRRCGVYVQPSRFEGFGVAVLEAMSCGAPVVTSGAGALPEVVGDAGVALPDRSPEAIAEAVCRVLADTPAAEDLGARARARAVSEFSVERRRQGLGREIDRLLGGGR